MFPKVFSSGYMTIITSRKDNTNHFGQISVRKTQAILLYDISSKKSKVNSVVSARSSNVKFREV